MSKRTVKFVSAISACFLACSGLAIASEANPNAADHCLSAPNGDPPGGGHWYYRIERTTKRHCWYVRGEKERSASSASQEPPPSDDAVSPQKPTSASAVDAHAELRLPQTRAEKDSPGTTLPADDASTENPTLAARWPQPGGVAPSASPLTSGPAYRVAGGQSTQTAIPPQPATTSTAAAVGPTIHDEVDALSGKHSSPIPKLLVVMFGALSVAGVVASAFLRTGAKRADRRKRPVETYPMWEPAPSTYRKSTEPRRGVGTAAADDPSRRIEEMLAQLTRNAPR